MFKNYVYADMYCTILIILIGASEVAHLAGVFLGRPLGQCSILLMCFFAVGILGLVIILLPGRRSGQLFRKEESLKITDILYGVIVLVLVASQIAFLIFGEGVFRQGNMTAETVESFLYTGRLYQVNPMTGLPYEQGLPGRAKILCLPTLYASLCELTGISSAVMLEKIIPVVILLGSYSAYRCLAAAFFPEKREARLLFMVVTAMVFWVGTNARGMDGFALLFAGWKAETIRRCILVPYTISLCIRKKYLHAILCCLAESCILWTRFGTGACFAVLIGMGAAALISGAIEFKGRARS